MVSAKDRAKQLSTPASLPQLADGIARWDALARRLPWLLENLLAAPSLRLGEGAHIPAAPGIYRLTEGSQPVYIGQTRNLRRRLSQHGAAWARENQATFAFIRARAEAGLDPAFVGGRTRKALADDPEFAAIFSRARKHVATMTVRFIEVDNPELRTVFEVYASVVLGTENTFETH